MKDQLLLQAPSALATMIAQDSAFRGIGPAKAKALDQRFGADLRAAMERCDPAIAEIVGDEAAVTAFAAFETRAAEANVLEWLTTNGALREVGVPNALKIARCWGHEGLFALKDNPYLLTAFLSWSVVDRLARTLGVPGDDQRRIVAAVEAVLYRRLDADDTAAKSDDVIQEVDKLLYPVAPSGRAARATRESW